LKKKKKNKSASNKVKKDVIEIKPKPFLNLILDDITAMDISPTGDYILINALGFTLLIRVTPISKLKYYLIPIHLMKLKNTTNQSSNEEKKKETEDLEDIRKMILQDPSTIP
jgi:hypothetical protein